MSKVCTKCGIEKTLDLFSIQKRKDRPTDYYKSQCKPCHSMAVSLTQKKNPDAWRNTHYKRSYNIDLSEYNRMFESQEGKCMICLRHRTELTHNLKVDHDHVTRNVRGLLCSECNLALGLLKDSTERLTRAVTYLTGGDV
jgi:hypothetical protein